MSDQLCCHACGLQHVWDHRSEGFTGVPVELCDTEFGRALTLHLCHCNTVLAVTVVTEDDPNVVMVHWNTLDGLQAKAGYRTVCRCSECNRPHIWSSKGNDFRSSAPEYVETPSGHPLTLHICPRPCSAVIAVADRRTGVVYAPWLEE